MNEIKLTINGIQATGQQGQTILDIAKEHGIEIPTLCHDDRTEIYGSCGICVVEAEGNPKLLRACSTMAADGMSINTNSDRVIQSRKAALELLLSDHSGDCRPPCAKACPAETDCQGYVGLIANGEYKEALKLIKEKVPFPASIGRVCPHPCEDACRRELVEEPVAIAAMKKFVGDIDLLEEAANTPPIAPATGKRAAVVGGGPGGLTAAYFLRLNGHEVTVYDAMPLMGGMLRYGIPEYRLPKAVLQKEIDAIESLGIKFCNSVRVGADISLKELQDQNDAVIVAVGAWSSISLGCPGEELGGVIGGIEFLRGIDINSKSLAGMNVAVVGGGNTAMDACRTAVRLGAANVYNIYRRTKNEMPAEEIEIRQAEEEGVIFKNLTNPIEVLGKDGTAQAVRLQHMELGEPDASGRRSPVPIQGSEETLAIDMAIMALGQRLNGIGLQELELTRGGTILADEHTFATSVEGVFAVGDATNQGADIAISAIGEGKRAAEMVGLYLKGMKLGHSSEFLSSTEKTAEDFLDRQKQQRVSAHERDAGVRSRDFAEIDLPMPEQEAKNEAFRCLECGCRDYFECKLIDYANRYNVEPDKYRGLVNHNPKKDEHPFIVRDPDKCILCGLCVRVCDEVIGATALGFVDRGFVTSVKPALGADLADAGCIACGLCAQMCPTGALTERQMIAKQVPLAEEYTEGACDKCPIECKMKIAVKGSLKLRALPAKEGGLLCYKGKFGFAGNAGELESLKVPAGIQQSLLEKIAKANGYDGPMPEN
ncbi:MAG: FAD-dependent oxidoreductase [Eubacteriaceae bacterium]|nr:FAD-dependent oxidoreductase [Eubacteriaceae bacterium]